MKYIKLFEAFTKDYMKKIDLNDFKKIKKGTKIKYMGGSAVVIDNNGYVLKLKGEDGKTVTVNKSQFDHGGMISEISVTNEGLKAKTPNEVITIDLDMGWDDSNPEEDKATFDTAKEEIRALNTEVVASTDRVWLKERASFQGSTSRSIQLPKDCDESNITATMEDGVLTVVVPRLPPQQPKVVNIE